MEEIIVGIDLGTTNSEIAAFIDGKPQCIGNGQQFMLPSCVGISPTGTLLIGEAARNQMLLYPERTARSVKRLMGSGESVTLGDKTFTPPEISALILRELARWAEVKFGAPVKKAVITVPAYFSDSQRNATREAGELAGLEVVRIVNEPTAASLAYGVEQNSRRTVMVYDLGGGTFDVSVVRIEGEITEVLASHGNNRLGGDDFDEKVVDHLLTKFREQHNVDLRDRNPGAYARLWWAAEAAKKQLSFEPYARIREESLLQIDGKPLHLDIEITRGEYEAMIRPLIDQTLESVSKALSDAGLLPSALDAVLLVGGLTRTPLVSQLLEKMCGKPPRQELHPDLCVALGAGVLASRMSGHEIDRVLVDVSPFSFGPSHLGEWNGRPYSHCYRSVIKRNTPLPITRTEEYFTASDFQTGVDLDIYQGDDPDAMNNVHVGNFKIDGLKPIEGPNSVLCRMRLDLDGILHVTAIEKSTGMSRHVAISGATRKRNSQEITLGRERLNKLFSTTVHADAEHIIDPIPAAEDAHVDAFGSLTSEADVAAESTTAVAPASAAPVDREWAQTVQEAQTMQQTCRSRIAGIHADDKDEAMNLLEEIEMAIANHDPGALATATKAMSEFLYFVEGK